jgi:hypothetical protein
MISQLCGCWWLLVGCWKHQKLRLVVGRDGTEWQRNVVRAIDKSLRCGPLQLQTWPATCHDGATPNHPSLPPLGCFLS